MIAQFSFELSYLITRIAGNDTVHQRRAKCIGLIQPLNKRFRQRPFLSVAQNQFTQRITVIINQFARDDNPAFIQCAVKIAEAFEQQTRQFSRITYRWRVVKLIARVVTDTCFRGVREHKTHIRIMCQLQELIVFAIDADFTVN